MKLTVFSDSHGNMENVLRIFDDSPADRYLFCGDGLTDAEDAAHLRDVPLTAVAGNCDYGSTARTEWLLELEGVRILLTHGHGYAVKQGTGALLRRARELEAKVVLFGHTHQRLLEEADGVLLINPGSCRDERYYAELEVETGQILTAQLCLGSPRITRRQKPTWWQPSR